MGMFDFLKAKKNTASIANDRLRIIIAQERTNRAGPDYLPLLQRELLEVIRKYVSVDVDAVKVDVVKDGEHDVLDISVALPEGRAAPDRPSPASPGETEPKPSPTGESRKKPYTSRGRTDERRVRKVLART